MSIVSLVSGGLDSTVMALLISEIEIEQFPLFINYGQRSIEDEWLNCKQAFESLKLPTPYYLDVSSYGKMVPSGLTNKSLDVVEDAFTPGRNFLFLTLASSYAAVVKADSLAIGLLNEETAIFPDQSDIFLEKANEAINEALFNNLRVVTPLRDFYKQDVVTLAKNKNITQYYSCHTGGNVCGECIACKEYG